MIQMPFFMYLLSKVCAGRLGVWYKGLKATAIAFTLYSLPSRLSQERRLGRGRYSALGNSMRTMPLMNKSGNMDTRQSRAHSARQSR